MHELTVAENIIGIVAAAASQAGAGQVSEVHLEIGSLAGIEYESLEFALNTLKPGTVMSDAIFVIEKPGGMATCSDCGEVMAFEDFMGVCESCGSSALEISGGNELRVKSVVI